MHSKQTADRACDFEEFTDMIHALLKAAWGSDWGTFTEAFPNGTDPTNVELPVITYSLKEKRPGIVGNRNTQEIKPRFREEHIGESPDGSPQFLSIYSQLFDNDVVFEVWEENNVKANKAAKRFEDFMRMYTGYFKQNGVQEMIFHHMDRTSEVGEWKDNIVCRKYQYLVRLEDHTVVPNDVITKVTEQVTLMKE